MLLMQKNSRLTLRTSLRVFSLFGFVGLFGKEEGSSLLK